MALVDTSIRPVTSAGYPRIRIQLASFLLISGLLLLPFDDLGGPFGIAGGLTKSPAWLPLCLAASLLPRSTGRGRKFESRILQLWLLGNFITLVSLPFLPEVAKGESLLEKGIRVSIILAAYFGVMIAAMRAYQHVPQALKLGTIATTILFFLYAVVGYALPSLLESMQWLHSTPNYAMRQRGTRFEASSLGAGLLICVAMTILWLRGRFALVVALISLPIVLELTQSRGTLVASLATAATGILILLVNSRVVHSKGFVGILSGLSIVCSLLFAFALQYLVTSELWKDLSKAVSDATRSIWADSALQSILNFPFGMGYAGPTFWMQDIFSKSLMGASTLFPFSDLSEAVGLVRTSESDAFSPKTMLALTGMYFGIPGVVAALVCFWRIISSWAASNSSTLLGFLPACILFVFVTSSYFSSPFSWEQPLLFGTLMALSHKFREAKDCVVV